MHYLLRNSYSVGFNWQAGENVSLVSLVSLVALVAVVAVVEYIAEKLENHYRIL